MTGSLRLEFAAPSPDYLGRLSRLRWRRAFSGAPEIGGKVQVADERAIPCPRSAEAVLAAAGRWPGSVIYPLDSGAAGTLGWTPPPVSTLRELEETLSGAEPSGECRLGGPPADFSARFVPDRRSGESVAARGFRVVRLRRSFGVREEIIARIPPASRRLLDVGCGAGETAAEAGRRIEGLRVEGIDRDPELSGSARDVLQVFHEGDALRVMASLRAAGERFDVLLFADALEHFGDPRAALEAAAALGERGATLIVSVPNLAGATMIGDLIAGRFDPVAAGPQDAGHLAWFTRRALREAVEEAGFADFRCEPVAHPRDDGLGARLSGLGIPFSPEDLGAIQWIATARLREAR